MTEYRVDRKFRGVGRIHLVSGAKTAAEHRKRDALLTELYDTGRLGLLSDIKAHRLTINQVYDAKMTGRLGFVAADIVLRQPLWAALEAWLPDSGRAVETRRRHGISVRALRRTAALGPGANSRDLAAVPWRSVYNAWPGGPAGWNRMRATVSLFLSMTLGTKHHPFRREVIDAMPHPQEPSGQVPDLTPEGFVEILDRVTEPLRPAYVLLAATGARPGEYLRLAETDLLPHTHAVRIPGTKTAGSVRTVFVPKELWPSIVAAVPAPVSYQVLYKLWKRACKKAKHPELTLYSLRHFFGQQMAEAGVPEWRIAQNLGHQSVAMTRRYTRGVDKGENARVVGQWLVLPARLRVTRAG